jgi:hypothetical protein
MANPDLPDFDGQDGAEVLDETNYNEDDVGEMRTFEELPDVLDVTEADGDRDDDEALALDSDEFDEDAIDDDDPEDDRELSYRAATEEREDDLDGQGPEDNFNEDRLARRGVDGLDEVGDAESVLGGEDDVTDYQAREVSDADLKRMGYAETRGGETRAKPNR